MSIPILTTGSRCYRSRLVTTSWILFFVLTYSCFASSIADDSVDQPMLTATDDLTATILVGTYTNGDSQGVYRLSLNLETGQLAPLGLVTKLEQPSFLAAADGLPDHFVAVHETGQFKGESGGGLSLLKFEVADGTASVVANRSTGGGAPCHVAMNPTGNRIAVANYSGGSYITYRLSIPTESESQGESQGESSLSVGDLWLSPGSFYQNKGSSSHPQRQQAPHGHCVRFLPGDDNRIVAADLGTDEVLVFQVSEDKADLVLEKIGSLKLEPGSGPRQIDFHPNGQWMYVINELNNTISQVTIPDAAAEMRQVGSVTTLPADFNDRNSTAHIQVHPSGRFVYGSNRGHDSVVIFRVDEGTGELTMVGHQMTGGKNPRHFLVEASGQFLLVANQNSDDVRVFRIDPETGRLSTTPFQAEVPTPVCLMQFR